MFCGAKERAVRARPQVLHARTCSGTARQLVYFFAAAHLIFSTGCDNVFMAVDSLPPMEPRQGGQPGSPSKLGPWRPPPAPSGGGGRTQ